MCYLHKWGKWKPISVTVFPYGGERKTDKQERQCTRCGLTQRKGMS